MLASNCDHLCETCCKHLQIGNVLQSALAKGLWVGDVTEELSSLWYIEKLLVQHVCVNGWFFCVASSGMRKMVAHAIVLTLLLQKYTTPCHPQLRTWIQAHSLAGAQKSSFPCTWMAKSQPPRLFRLEYCIWWVRKVSRKHPPPVCVEYQFSLTNKIEEGISLFDSTTADGVDDVLCSFVVHGVTGEQLGTKIVAALKGIAMKHWNNKGAALSMSHMAEPRSVLNNSNLYPQIFPWLFSYGSCGIGSSTLSEKAHKEFLFMYYSLWNQQDMNFSQLTAEMWIS